MSLVYDHPHLETGDVGSVLSSWEVEGFSISNNDHGRVYVRDNAGTIEASKTRAFAALDLVASGPDVASGATLVLSPANGSGMTIRALRSDGSIGSSIVVWFFLANEGDLRRKDNQLGAMLLRGEVDFLEPMCDTMREFLARMASIYPPAPVVGYPNDLVKSSIETGTRGSPEWYAQFFWSVNTLGEFEITGLQNPGDYRIWFLNQCLALIYSRKARTGDTSDPIFSRQIAFQLEADRLWNMAKPWVDVDRNLVADRQPKVRNVRLRRG